MQQRSPVQASPLTRPIEYWYGVNRENFGYGYADTVTDKGGLSASQPVNHSASRSLPNAKCGDNGKHFIIFHRVIRASFVAALFVVVSSCICTCYRCLCVLCARVASISIFMPKASDSSRNPFLATLSHIPDSGQLKGSLQAHIYAYTLCTVKSPLMDSFFERTFLPGARPA